MMDGITIQKVCHHGLEADNLKMDAMCPAQRIFKQLFPQHFQRMGLARSWSPMQRPAQRLRLRHTNVPPDGPYSPPQGQHPWGRRQGAAALNPGAGPGRRPVLMPEASVGNRRLYAWTPPAADRPWPDLGPTLARPWVDLRPHLQPVIFHRILCLAFKNTVFYGVSGPSAATDFILAMFKNRGFYVVLGSREGKKSEKLAS